MTRTRVRRTGGLTADPWKARGTGHRSGLAEKLRERCYVGPALIAAVAEALEARRIDVLVGPAGPSRIAPLAWFRGGDADAKLVVAPNRDASSGLRFP